MAALVRLEKAVSPDDYLSGLLGTNSIPHVSTCFELREWLDQNGYSEYWDKPLSEIDEIVAQEQEVILVRDSKDNYRWFEV